MGTTTPSVDLDWAVNEDMPPGPYPRDSQFVFQRVPELVTQVATRGKPGRVLDVACGLGGQMELLRASGWQTWGLDASTDLTRYCRERFDEDSALGRAPLVNAIAEALPFRDGTFDRVVCQGSLDHFARPRSFMREVARVLKPDGQAIIGISNFDSLSCLISKSIFSLRERCGLPVYRGRNFWQIPNNHTFRGTYRLLSRMGEPHLELVECRGASMLWLFHRWTRLMEALPERLAWSAMKALDRIAYRAPAVADLVISVWQPRSER